MRYFLISKYAKTRAFPWSKSSTNLSEYEICFVLTCWKTHSEPWNHQAFLFEMLTKTILRLILNIDVNLICISFMESTFFSHTFFLTQVIIWCFEISHLFTACSTLLPYYRTWFKNWWFAMITEECRYVFAAFIYYLLLAIILTYLISGSYYEALVTIMIFFLKENESTS